jgi:hypothetical protein
MTAPDIDPDWTLIRRRQFLGDLLSARKWYDSAAELQAAADLLRPRVKEWWAILLPWQREKQRIFIEHGGHRAYMMLTGFVVENLCKGAILSRLSFEDRRMVETTARLPKWLQTHNLRSLVRRIDLPVSDLEQDILHRTTRMVKWDGRYPVAVSFAEEGHTLTLDDGSKYSATWIGENDVDRIEAFCDRLRDYVGARRSYRVVPPDELSSVNPPGA